MEPQPSGRYEPPTSAPARHLDLAWSTSLNHFVAEPPPGVEDVAVDCFEAPPAQELDDHSTDHISDLDEFEEFDEISFPSPGVARSTWLLAGALTLVLAFGAGIITQKRHDVGLVRPQDAAAAAIRNDAAGAAAGAGAPVTGTVTAASATELTVHDDKGADHKVTVDDKTPMVKKIGAKDLSTGTKVVVQGTTDSSGVLHAQAVVVP